MIAGELKSTFWQGKKVFLTGHTGFKGGWLALWLSSMGAHVHGYALAPSTSPSFFVEASIKGVMASHTIADIRDANDLKNAMLAAQPEIVLHLAAQPLVRHSYVDPVETYATNVMGTVNLFEAVRSTGSVRAVVNVTTDKCYENKETLVPYTEDAPMGGYDPYSSSKGCAELVTASYRQSFLAEKSISVASARAGNVIGGGDWSNDRLIPDFLNALDRNEELVIRSPYAIRPWQHVLEPLMGYLQLAEKLVLDGQAYAQAWNFGPSEKDAKSVEWVVESLVKNIPDAHWRIDDSPHPHEAHYLKLDSTKANNALNWKPKWALEIALEQIMAWHAAWHGKADMQQFSLNQIASYQQVTSI